MKHVRLPDIQATFNADGTLFLRSGSTGLGVKAPPFVTAILAACAQPSSRDDIAARLGPNAAGAYDQLVEIGLLTTPEKAHETPVIFGNYAGIEVHRRMLSDDVRIETYRAALNAVVQPGDVVIDAGSGSGVLATLAALAGARKVYAIEKTDMAQVIPQVAGASGVGDIVEVIQGDITQVRTPEKARVMVHELIGAWAFGEGFMPDLAICAKNNLAEGGVVIPGGVTFWLAPLRTAPSSLLHPFRRWEDGLDLTPLLPEARGRASLLPADPDAVGPAIEVAQVALPCDGTFGGTVEIEGPCEALVGWFDLHMAPGLLLPAGPHDPLTHWKQSIIPVALPEGRHTLQIRGGADPGDRRTMMVAFDAPGVRQDVRFR